MFRFSIKYTAYKRKYINFIHSETVNFVKTKRKNNIYIYIYICMGLFKILIKYFYPKLSTRLVLWEDYAEHDVSQKKKKFMMFTPD